MKAKAAAEVHETVLSLLANEKRGRLLDAAAGEGALTKELLKLGFEVHPVDKDTSIFEVQEVECEKIDLNTKLPYPDDSFDYITSVETIEHLWNPYGAVQEFHRILRNGGKLILTTPNILTAFSRILFLFTGKFAGFLGVDHVRSGHVTPISLWQLEWIFHQVGFVTEDLTFNRGYLPLLRLKLPFKNLSLGQILIVKAAKKPKEKA